MIDNLNAVKEAKEYAVQQLQHFDWVQGIGISFPYSFTVDNTTVKYALKIWVADESAREYVETNLFQIVPNLNKIPVIVRIVEDIEDLS